MSSRVPLISLGSWSGEGRRLKRQFSLQEMKNILIRHSVRKVCHAHQVPSSCYGKRKERKFVPNVVCHSVACRLLKNISLRTTEISPNFIPGLANSVDEPTHPT